MDQQNKSQLQVSNALEEKIKSLEEASKAMLNILEDFNIEKLRFEETQRASFNILEDFNAEKLRLKDTERATLNILDDFNEEKSRLEETQKATLNILEDFDTEKMKVETANLTLSNEIAERKRAEEELRQRQRELTVRNRIADIFLTVPDDRMYYEVLKAVLETMESMYGIFGFIDETGALVVPSMTRHIWDKCQVPDKTIVFPRDKWGESIWPRAIRQKKTLYSNDTSTIAPKGHVMIRRNIAVPILDQEDVVGLFQVANKETDYDQNDVRLLETIAAAVAPVLHARLQRDVQEKERQRAEEVSRKLNEDLRRRADEVEAANKELEAFSYSVSHDLRGPLRAIDGFSRILLQDYMSTLDDEGKRLLNIVSNNTRKMGQLIDDILSFSRVGRKEIGFSEINMEKLTKDVLKELNPDTIERKIEIVVKPLPNAHADVSMIRQVLVNLLSNSIKFTKPRAGALIEIGCNTSASSAKGGKSGFAENVYYVKDNGVGFDMTYASKLFGVFQRLHGVDEFEGTGIGLAIVKRVIDKHGGRVWAEGKIHEGAIFSFTLPGAILKK